MAKANYYIQKLQERNKKLRKDIYRVLEKNTRLKDKNEALRAEIARLKGGEKL